MKRKKKASTNAIREIKNQQKKTSLIIPSAPFSRVVHEIAQSYKTDLRIKADAYTTLQYAAEDFMINAFQKSNKCAIHQGRETIQSKDLKLAMSLSD
mgnify:CR=1 FL=1